jgi:hypothetical protein
MSKKCPKCESIAVVYEDYVGGTLFYRCQTCGHIGSDFEKKTLFDRITASPEVLAEKLVFAIGRIVPDYNHVVTLWYSTIIPDITFETRTEAIAATVEKLKEVEK